MCMYVFVRMCVCMYAWNVCMYVCMYVCNVCTYALCMCVRMYSCVCIMYICMSLFYRSATCHLTTHTHTHTHAHTNTLITALSKHNAHQIIQSHEGSKFCQQLSSSHPDTLSDHAASSLLTPLAFTVETITKNSFSFIL